MEDKRDKELQMMASIFLRVKHPDLPMWLDEMIERANRSEYAGLAMLGLLAELAHPRSVGSNGLTEEITKKAVEFSDALIEELKK